MRTILTLAFLCLCITIGYSGDKKKKPTKCTPYGCTDWAWKQNKNAFDPHSIKWPLHHTGETHKDGIDGGNDHIDVVFNYHGQKHRIPLQDYRNSVYHPDPWFLDEGIDMKPAFECEPWWDEIHAPWWTDNLCSLVDATYEDKEVYIDGPGCSKIIRTWTIIDWCKWEPNTTSNTRQEKYVLVKDVDQHKAYWAYGKEADDIEHDGWYTFDQVIKVVDYDAPYLADCDDIEVEVEDACSVRLKLPNKVLDEGQCPSQRIAVEYTVKDIHGYVVAQDWLHAAHDQEFRITLGYVEHGSYVIHWSLRDGCGNTSSCKQNLKVMDNSPPQIICVQNLSTSMGRDGQVSIWAKDFVKDVKGSCYDKDVTISFYPDSVAMSLTFDCTDGVGVHEREVYAIGSNGVYVSCNVTLTVADRGSCDTTGMTIVGRVTSLWGESIADAEIVVESHGDYVSSGMSNHQGSYVVRGISYDTERPVITGTVHEESTRGLDGYDLLYLIRHITGVEKFTKVHQYAAADMNLDGEVDMTDYWILQDAIYDLPNFEVEYDKWKVYYKWPFTNGFRTHMDLLKPRKLSRIKFDYPLIALKSGDIDFSWRSEPAATSRSITQHSSWHPMGSGTLIKVPSIGVSIHSLILDVSEDFTLSDIKAEDTDLVYQILDGPSGRQLIVMTEDDLSGRGLQMQGITGVLRGTGQIYAESDEFYQWAISESTAELTLAPNPVIDQVLVSLEHHATDKATIRLINLQGQSVFTYETVLVSGFNQMSVPTIELRAGMYVLTLETSRGVQSRRFLKM